jgi:hypothetical protein
VRKRCRFFVDVSNRDNFNCSLPTSSYHYHRLAQVATSEHVRDDNNVDERYPSPNNTCPTAESNDICPPAKLASDDDNGIAQGAAYVRAHADNNANEHNPTANDTRPPAVKSGFRGKPATKKFGVYGKRGGKQKANPLGRQDPFIGINLESTPHFESRRRITADRKITKMLIVKRLSIVTGKLRKAQIKKEVALSDNECLTRKVSKTKDVVEELRTCLKDSCQEVRSCKSLITRAEQDHTSSTVAAETKHKCTLNTMVKMTTGKMMAKDSLHALELENKDNEIMVS